MEVTILKCERIDNVFYHNIKSNEPLKVGDEYFVSVSDWGKETVNELLLQALELTTSSSREAFDEVHGKLRAKLSLYR